LVLDLGKEANDEPREEEETEKGNDSYADVLHRQALRESSPFEALSDDITASTGEGPFF
jgi:hypothetical protein